MKMIYASDNPQAHWHSSIDQYKGFLSVIKKGGYTPIVFDQLDGITCETLHTRPVIISFGDFIGYHYPEAKCSFVSDKFIYFDHEGVEEKLLPESFGGQGEFYLKYIKANSFVNFDNDQSVGVRSTKTLRVGLDYVLADKMLPVAE